MGGMGHDNMRTALIYQHANTTSDQQISDAIEDLIGDRDADATEPTAGEDDPDDDPDDGCSPLWMTSARRPSTASWPASSRPTASRISGRSGNFRKLGSRSCPRSGAHT
jgi:hypothetical protein